MAGNTREPVTPARGREQAPHPAVETGAVRTSEVPPLVRPMREPGASWRPRREQAVNIGTGERAVSVLGGSLLAFYGLTRRSWLARLPLAGIGAALAYRGATGHSEAYRRIGIERAGAPAELAEAVTVNRPAQEVYAFWRKLENLPKFMRHIRSVRELSPTRSHWTAEALRSGRTLEWDADIVEEKPNELIRWRSVPNGAVQHSGEVRFKRAPGERGTEVHVRMEYRPPMGAPAIAALTYPFSRQMMKEELRRLKRVLEAGEIPTIEGQPSGRRRTGRLRRAGGLQGGAR